jgi:hypothetical protein
MQMHFRITFLVKIVISRSFLFGIYELRITSKAQNEGQGPLKTLKEVAREIKFEE